MRNALEQLVSEKVVMSVIMLNAAILFTRAFPLGQQLEANLFLVDYACTVFFLIELGIKVGLNGWKGYWSSGWNRFDFSVVIISAPMLLAPFMDVEALGIVLVLRTGRLLRVMRLFHFIPNRDHLLNGVLRALRASVGVFFALVVYNFILAIFSCQLFSDVAPEYFGNPLVASYSLFKIFTIEGWFEIPDLIATRSTPATAAFARMFFGFVVLTGGILGLSLANAVFVDEMVIDNTNHIEDRLDRLTSMLEAYHSRNESELAQIQSVIEEIREH